MNQSDNTLETKVKKILLQDWDPIGVKDISEAKDEYDTYVPNIGRMLRAGLSNVEIYNHLRCIEVNRMGLSGNKAHTQKIAERLHALAS